MLAARAKIIKSAVISAYTVMASHPGSTGEVVAPCKVMAGLFTTCTNYECWHRIKFAGRLVYQKEV